MLVIRLARTGRKNQPSFRVVVKEKRSKLTGRCLEELGWYNPLLGKHEIPRERVQYWMGKGAQPSDTVFNMLVADGIVTGPKRKVRRPAKKQEGEAAVSAKSEEK